MGDVFKRLDVMNPRETGSLMQNQVTYLSDDDDDDEQLSDNDHMEEDEDYKTFLKQQNEHRPSAEIEAYQLMFEQEIKGFHKSASHPTAVSTHKNTSTTTTTVSSHVTTLPSTTQGTGNIKSILTDDELNQWNLYKNDQFHSLEEEVASSVSDEGVANNGLVTVSESPVVTLTAVVKSEPIEEVGQSSLPVSESEEKEEDDDVISENQIDHTTTISEQQQSEPEPELQLQTQFQSEFEDDNDFEDGDPFAHIENEAVSDSDEIEIEYQ